MKKKSKSLVFSIKDIKSETEKHWIKRHKPHYIVIIKTQEYPIEVESLHCKECNEIFVRCVKLTEITPKRRESK